MGEREDRARAVLAEIKGGYWGEMILANENDGRGNIIRPREAIAAMLAFANAELSRAAQVADDEVMDIESYVPVVLQASHSGLAIARVIRDGILRLKDE